MLRTEFRVLAKEINDLRAVAIQLEGLYFEDTKDATEANTFVVETMQNLLSSLIKQKFIHGEIIKVLLGKL